MVDRLARAMMESMEPRRRSSVSRKRTEPVTTSRHRTSTADRAVDFIREAIIDGTYPAEVMLSEADLAAQLEVSRTPVRTALARLQDEGWVRIYPKRGAMVLGLSTDEITDLAHARFVLESSGITLASTQTRVRLAEELEPMLDDQRDAFNTGDVARFIELTIAFHQAFLDAGDNRYLIDLGGHLADRQRWMLFADQDGLLERSDHILGEHQQLVERLRDDDPIGFSEVLRRHVTEDVGSNTGAL